MRTQLRKEKSGDELQRAYAKDVYVGSKYYKWTYYVDGQHHYQEYIMTQEEIDNGTIMTLMITDSIMVEKVQTKFKPMFRKLKDYEISLNIILNPLNWWIGWYRQKYDDGIPKEEQYLVFSIQFICLEFVLDFWPLDYFNEQLDESPPYKETK